MANQKSFLKVQGTIGGLTFYQMNGKDFIKRAGGVSKERILNDPRFKRTRENNQEFSGAAKVAKAIRLALVNGFKTMADSSCSSRIMKLCRDIIGKENGIRGQRSFVPVTHKEMFRDFRFNNSLPLESVFMAPYTQVANAERNQVVLTIPGFNPANLVNAPAGATHFRIEHRVFALSQYDFNLTSRLYDPADVVWNTKNQIGYSDYFPVNENISSATMFTTTLPGAPAALPADTLLITCIGIEFYQNVSGEYYLLAMGNTMKVGEVY
jgi:hypothetical protein